MQDLKEFRNKLDSEDHKDLAEVSELVEKEHPSFTDYLNFFEFVAYLCESKQITKGEMEGLFDYYLGNLQKNQGVANYIKDSTKGFERLQRVLQKRKG